MILGRLNHVGVATPSIAQAIPFWRDVMGATAVGAAFDLPEQGVRVAFVDLPNVQIELLEPLGESPAMRSFLQRNPRGGQHHLCYEVPDIAVARAWFGSRDTAPLGPTRIGAHGTPIFFLHPRHMGGILTEIMETPPGDH